MAESILVEARNLCRTYGQAVQIRALDDVSLAIDRGENVAVMGASGSGKSTLLNMMGALDNPTSGQVIIDGQDLATIADIDKFRSETVGFVFQMHNLIPTLTAQENIEIPLRGRGLRARQRRERALEMLSLVGLTERRDHLPGQLSGGQRQRAAVARALVNDPKLILADEPTGNLDSVSGQEIIDLLNRLNREHGTTLLIVTHDRHVARSCQRILTMMDGRIIEEHRVRDSLTEDLRELARSDLGRCLASGGVAALADLPFVENGQLTPTATRLAHLLAELAPATCPAEQRNDL
jgi:ABC-type lipoprotein export system ATPase subunit